MVPYFNTHPWMLESHLLATGFPFLGVGCIYRGLYSHDLLRASVVFVVCIGSSSCLGKTFAIFLVFVISSITKRDILRGKLVVAFGWASQSRSTIEPTFRPF